MWWPGLSSQVQELVRNCSNVIRLQSLSLLSILVEKQSLTYFILIRQLIFSLLITFLNSSKLPNWAPNLAQKWFIIQSQPFLDMESLKKFFQTMDLNTLYLIMLDLQLSMDLPIQPAVQTSLRVMGKQKAVQTIKHLLRKSDYLHMALMIYHFTPFHNGYSPSSRCSWSIRSRSICLDYRKER